MSLLNFPPEVTLQFIRKMNFLKRCNLSIAVPRLAPLCFDRTLDRKSMKTITLNELHQWYKQSSTEEERELCFEANILDRLRISNFNEVVHLHMDSDKNKTFADNPKILQSLKAKIVLDGENEDLSQEFWETFLCLLDKVEGDLLLVFMNIKSFENINIELYKEIISRKRKRGDKFYFISYNNNNNIRHYLYPLKGASSFTYVSRDHDRDDDDSDDDGSDVGDYDDDDGRDDEDNRDGRMIYHSIRLNRETSVEVTKLVIEMTNDVNKLSDCKQHLLNFLPELERLQKIVVPENDIVEDVCDFCGAESYAAENCLWFNINQPAWSNCTGCVMK